MKTPEEIKKGLELCVNGNSFNYPCDECPYANEEDGCKNMMADALAYIQQLEAQNAELVRKTDQLQRERDAAVADAHGRCFSCRHGGVRESDEPCRTCLFETEGCISDKPAWEWRGVPEPPKEE